MPHKKVFLKIKPSENRTVYTVYSYLRISELETDSSEAILYTVVNDSAIA